MAILKTANILIKQTFIIRKYSSEPPWKRGGIPYENMPFKYRNKFQMTLIHTLFWGSGLAAPMLLIRYILWRRRQT